MLHEPVPIDHWEKQVIVQESVLRSFVCIAILGGIIRHITTQYEIDGFVLMVVHLSLLGVVVIIAQWSHRWQTAESHRVCDFNTRTQTYLTRRFNDLFN